MPEMQQKPATPPPDITGRTLGDFQILRRIGTGGMGQVYLARQISLKREVALKLLRNDLNSDPTALARFQAEAQAVAKLNHPNIVHIHQIGESDGLRYMVLEFVEGRNLRDYLARKGPPDLPISLSIMRQVAAALQKAHEQGIIHRDIKPENILVTRKVEVKVTDFGLSRFFTPEAPPSHLTQSGLTLGTPLYMSPEQVQGQPLDHRSDIYSFGVTCYHLLAGEPPFRGSSPFDVAFKHVHEWPRPLIELRPDLPADLCGMVHKMMAKNPADRYPSAREIIRDLIKIRDGLTTGTATLATVALTPAAAPPAPAENAPGPRPSKWRGGLLIGGCLIALLLGAMLQALWSPAEPAAGANASPPVSGLIDIRPPERIITLRERELLTVLNSEDTKPDDAIKASLELGLLYLKEHRLAEAADRFERLRAREREWRDPVAARTASLAGRLGLAVVLAHEKDKAEASNKVFLDVVTEPWPKFGGPKFERSIVTASWVLLRFPDLSNAVTDALNRNAVNLGKTKLEPQLEQLRSPQRIGAKD
ncbi:MAG: serine/threonine-protein kinase [Gemmataceae bacterium]|nr:serine/threonine-protein kinase [Gemmata sp.]MDW8197204.1 serine/threonine-protein kinase [Gemmataceae bacterium]